MTSRSRRIIVLAAAIAAISLSARLGFWQLDRAAQKEAVRSALDQRSRLPSLSALDLVHDPQAAAGQHHRSVQLRGRWLADKTVYLDNRPMNGRAGFIVVTPLLLDPGPGAVLVQRGWLARDARERTLLPAFTTLSGPVDVMGRLAAPPSRLFEFEDSRAPPGRRHTSSAPRGGESTRERPFVNSSDGPIRQNLDTEDYAREIRVALAPLSVLESDSPSTKGDGLLRQWPSPTVDVHKNYGYAAQWFALAALTAGLYVWFQFIKPRLGRAR